MFTISRPLPAQPWYLRAKAPLRVLVCGAHGWIGRAVVKALQARGHTILCGQRSQCGHIAGTSIVPIDFMHDTRTDVWIPRLKGVDVVVNTVGIFAAASIEVFQRVHVDTPMALFEACKRVGVRRIVHLSARINPARQHFPYMSTKQASEALLHEHYKNWIIIRPSMIIGDSGRNSAAFRSWASMPILGIPAQATGKFQPIGIEDVVELIVTAVEGKVKDGTTLDAVGPEAINYQRLLEMYRRALGLPPARTLILPRWLSHYATLLIQRLLPEGVMSPDALKLLEIGSTADPHPAQEILDRPLRPLKQLIAELETPGNRAWAIQSWIHWFIRFSLAIVWIVSTIVSLLPYTRSLSTAWITHLGIPTAFAFPIICAASSLNFTMGTLTLLRASRRLWEAQAGLIVLYITIITIGIPQLWLHPLGPIVKDIPILVCLLYLWITEKEDD